MNELDRQDCVEPDRRREIEVAIERHFAGALSPPSEDVMRQHLLRCASCRRLYDRHAALAALLPEALSAQERLARGLGFASHRSRTRIRVVRLTALAAAALLVTIGGLLALRYNASSAGSDDFTARGTTARRDRTLRIYRVEGAAVHPAGDRIDRDSELAFAVQAAAEDRYLMIFGVDATRRVFWFHPAWTEPKANPSAISLKAGSASGGRWRELREAIRHDLGRGPLFVHALFLRQSVSVRQVEGLIAAQQGSASAPLQLEGAVDLVHALKVSSRSKGSR